MLQFLQHNYKSYVNAFRSLDKKDYVKSSG
jgi:hypothetical protein